MYSNTWHKSVGRVQNPGKRAQICERQKKVVEITIITNLIWEHSEGLIVKITISSIVIVLLKKLLFFINSLSVKLLLDSLLLDGL